MLPIVRLLEIKLAHEYPELQVPMQETFCGTFEEKRNHSRNFSGIWALRSLLLPVLLIITLFAYFIVGVITVLNLILVSIFLLLNVLALISYIRIESNNAKKIVEALGES